MILTALAEAMIPYCERATVADSSTIARMSSRAYQSTTGRSRKYFSLTGVGKAGSGPVMLFDCDQLYHLMVFFATQVSRRGSVIQADSDTIWFATLPHEFQLLLIVPYL